MSTGSQPVRDSLWARLAHDPKHGPLPILLLLLTLMTGVIDAVSIIALGRVFVANMTGNVVFIGFAVAQVPGFSLAASLSALAGFLVGAFGGGVVLERLAAHRGHLLRASCAVELLLVAISLVVIAPSASDPDLTVTGRRIRADVLPRWESRTRWRGVSRSPISRPRCSP